jgi:peptide/nickel transport system substrate-binding protein
MAAKLKSDLAQIGVTVNIVTVQDAELYARYRAHNVQLVLAQISPDSADPGGLASAFCDFGGNFVAWRLNWNNPDLGAAVERANNLPNGDQRLKLYSDIVKTFWDQAPVAVLYQPLATVGHAASVKLKYNPYYGGIDPREVSKQ